MEHFYDIGGGAHEKRGAWPAAYPCDDRGTVFDITLASGQIVQVNEDGWPAADREAHRKSICAAEAAAYTSPEFEQALADFMQINGDSQNEDEEEKPVEPSGAEKAWAAAKGIFKPFARQPPKELFIPMLDMSGSFFEFLGATHLQRFDMPKARNGSYRVEIVDALGQKHMVSSRAFKAADPAKAREHAYHANELQARQVHGFGSGLRGIDPSAPPRYGRHARAVHAAARRVFGEQYREDESDPWAAARIK